MVLLKQRVNSPTNKVLQSELKISNFVDDIVDSLPPGLLEGRPAGNSFFLTSHQLQQLQQQLQAAAVATASQQHQQTDQVATASGGLTLALHHATGAGGGVLTPQLLLTPQATPSFAAYPVSSAAQHTTSIQQVLQHHVRQSSILQSTIQQVGPSQTPTQPFAEPNNGILNGNSKCIPVPSASPFSSRSLTPSPQQTVFQPVMSATGPVLQLYQPTAATRATTVAAAAITPQPKNKPPQQILPKPISNIMTQTAIKPQPTQTSAPAGTLLLNQMIPNAGVLVGQQTSSGVQLILKSPSPQTLSASVPKAQVVVSSNGSLSTSPNTVFVQANRSQPQQVMRFITGQSLQLQQVHTSSGTALVAVPSIQPTLQQTTSTHTAAVVPSVATIPVQTSVFNQNVIKKTTNHVNSSSTCTSNHFSNNSFTSSNASGGNNRKKKRKEEETTKLDLANLIKISGIDEEDGAPTPTSISSTTSSLSSSLSSLSSSSSVSSSPPISCTVQTQSPPIVAYQTQRTQDQQTNQFHSDQQSFQQKNQFSSRPSTPKQNGAAPLITQLQTPATQQCGLRFSIGEDGQVILQQQQPPIASQQSVTASVAAAAQTQLAQLVAEHGGHILQTAVLSLTGSESIVLKTPTGFALRQSPQQVVLQRASTTPTNVVLTSSDSGAATNGVRILTDVGGLNGLAGKMQIVSGSTVQDHNRVQIVAAASANTVHQNPNTMSLTEQQQRVQIVTASAATGGVPDLSSMSLTTTTEQQNRLQILSVPNTGGELSLTEQHNQNRMEIISNVAGGGAGAVVEPKNRIQVIPNTRTVSLTEHLVSDISQQILSNVPTASNIHEQNTRVIFQQQNTGGGVERAAEHNLHISSSERTDTVHITSAAAATACESQSSGKLRVTASIPQTYSLALNEQNRYQLIPNPTTAEFTLDEKTTSDTGQKLEQHIRLNEQRMQIVESAGVGIGEGVTHDQNVTTPHQQQLNHHRVNDATPQGRFHVISNVEQQRFMQVNEEQNRIIVASSIEHQRVLNTSAVFNEQQNHVQMLTNGGTTADQQRLLQQLSEEQRSKIQIFTQPMTQQHRIVQLNEHQHQKLTINNMESMQEQKLMGQLTCQQQQHATTKVNVVQIKDNSAKLNHVGGADGGGISAAAAAAAAKLFNEFQDVKLPENEHSSEVLANNRFANQYVLQPGGKLTLATDCPTPMKSPSSRCNSFSGGSNAATGTATTIHVSINGGGSAQQQNFAHTKNSRTSVSCSPSTVISPRCTPSPHSPHYKSPSNHSPQSPAVNMAISSCFTNRPNLTVVTQSSPHAHTINQNLNHVEQGTGGLPHAQVKPCHAVISNSATVSASVAAPVAATMTASSQPQQATAGNFVGHEFCNERFVQPSMSSPSSQGEPLMQQSASPPVSNSFLDSIVQSHPNISINKTGIVPPCAKSNVMRAKKPKKSAVVKPMVFQSDDTKDKCNDGPACLNPVASNDGSHAGVVQRVQTIQLTPQKQQNLKIVQSEIAALSGKKTRTLIEQAKLQKLFNEQQKILLSGKIIPTVPGQNTQGLTFVSTPVRLVPPPTTPPSPHPPSTPPTCNKATSPLHVQVGTQTTLDEHVPAVASVPSPLAAALPIDPVVTSAPSTINVPPPPPTMPFVTMQQPAPVSPPVPVLPKLTPAKRAALIREQSEIDLRGATQPDTNTPFDSVSDACKRLLRYHSLDEPVLSEKDLEKADEIFEATAKHLLDKNAQMLNKYSYLICKESMREVQTSELIMLGRMFVADETQFLDNLKQELVNCSNPPSTCSIATQADGCSPPTTLQNDAQAANSLSTEFVPSGSQFDPSISAGGEVTGIRLKRDYDDVHSSSDVKSAAKKHCPDDEEINAQVQSAIDSILNLQRSDPATDEAVRSILPS